MGIFRLTEALNSRWCFVNNILEITHLYIYWIYPVNSRKTLHWPKVDSRQYKRQACTDKRIIVEPLVEKTGGKQKKLNCFK